MPNNPPKEFFDRMTKKVKKGNPEYSDEQVRKTVGDIWHNKMSPSKKQEETKKSEGSTKMAQVEDPVDEDLSAETSYAIRFDPEVHELLAQLHQGQSDPLYALVSRTINGQTTEATAEELQIAREELLGVIDTVAPEMAEGITQAVMDIDEKLSGSGRGGELGDVLEDTMSSLDDFFKGGKKTAVGFPNMLSPDTKKWIQLQTTNLAANKGTPATPEQAHAFIDAAAVEVAQELANAIGPEVEKVVDEFREKIFQDITTGVELAAPQAKPAQPTLPGIPQPPVAPAAASKKAKMSVALRKAFDTSYPYDVLALVLEAELGSDFPKNITADEVIDEEEALLDVAEKNFSNVERKDLVEAFGELLTDIYSRG